jgi:hypothetical protein
MKKGLSLRAPCFLLLAANVAFGCPVCNSGTGEQVRAGITDGNFAKTLFAVLLPFPVLLACLAVIRFGWPSRPQTRKRNSRDD